MAAGAALAPGSGVADADISTMTGTGNFAAGSTLAFDTAAGDRTFTTAVTGSIGLAKLGGNTLTLSASNAYTGPTTVNAGTLALSGSGDIGSSSGVSLNASGARVDISAAGGDRTIATLSGVAGSSVVLGANSLVVGGAASTAVAGPISGTGGLEKTGAGTLTLSGNNTFTGTTTVAAGTLALEGAPSWQVAGSRAGLAVVIQDGGRVDATQVSHQFGWTSNMADITVESGGVLDTTGRDQFLGSLVLNGSGTIAGNAANYIAPRGNLTANPVGGNVASIATKISLRSAADSPSGYNGGVHTFTIGDDATVADDLTISTEIYGAGSMAKAGAGRLVLSGSNTYIGGTAINAGTLTAASSTALGTAAVSIAAGGRLELGAGAVIANAITDLGTGSFLGTLDFAGGGLARTSTATGTWVNAIDGNGSGSGSFFQGSWSDYLVANPLATPTSALGVYGHDSTSNTAWAVIDHNSDFAVIVVPEPGTFVLAGLGLAGIVLIRSRSSLDPSGCLSRYPSLGRRKRS